VGLARGGSIPLDRTTSSQQNRTVTSYVALLRAVNVGGTGKLPMADLRALCEASGLAKVRTYIASGNVVFASRQSEAKVKALLEASLEDYAGKPVAVFVRTAVEMAQVHAANPFPDAAPNRVMTFFLAAPPPSDTLRHVTGRKDEQIALGRREIYVHYGDGMGTSKLRIRAALAGTARNMNTVAKLAELAAGL
jgi:uncharacterized protein (DUF1697 family)